MEWSNRKTATALVGEGTGRVDEASWELFLAEINAAIVEAAALDLPLVIDLKGIDYMSSRGLRVLTLAKRAADAANVGLTLARPNERMTEILAISRYDKIFTVTKGLEG
jgi:anti-sigma B factor antagonist